ncbi:hypothetical protein AA958_17190 [Streptomyces sp. CNQ-509]|nr:hypothetical protein AA958_17190 [Streptomyces sp. CNQ-509]
MQVRVVEEPHLTAVHGDAYAAYTARASPFSPPSAGHGLMLTRRSRRRDQIAKSLLRTQM